LLLNSRGLRAKRSPTAINFGPFGTPENLAKKQEVVGLLRREIFLNSTASLTSKQFFRLIRVPRT